MQFLSVQGSWFRVHGKVRSPTFEVQGQRNPMNPTNPRNPNTQYLTPDTQHLKPKRPPALLWEGPAPLLGAPGSIPCAQSDHDRLPLCDVPLEDLGEVFVAQSELDRHPAEPPLIEDPDLRWPASLFLGREGLPVRRGGLEPRRRVGNLEDARPPVHEDLHVRAQPRRAFLILV